MASSKDDQNEDVLETGGVEAILVSFRIYNNDQVYWSFCRADEGELESLV
jgi:hypothetical protein